MEHGEIKIIAFYEFKPLGAVDELPKLQRDLRAAMTETGVRGTIILAHEGYNGMVCGDDNEIARFLPPVEKILATTLRCKNSVHDHRPFRRIDVKIKPEIVTLKRDVDFSYAAGTHVLAKDWNRLISDPSTFVLDARNDYEFRTGTFHGAVNPKIGKFSDLPDFVAANLDPERHKRIAMFCTGGIRCEKFAPYMRQLGFAEVFQLEGGILKYLEETPPDKTLWEGECFVFDERVTVDANLRKGASTDLSQRMSNRKNPKYAGDE